METDAQELLMLKLSPKLLILASFVFSVSATPFLFISIYRIQTVQNLRACLLNETPIYQFAHGLCPALPAIAVILALLSLIRVGRFKAKLSTKLLAVSALLLPIILFAVYCVKLLQLAQ